MSIITRRPKSTPRVRATVAELFPNPTLTIVPDLDDEQSPDELESTRLYVETHPEFMTKFPGHFTELRNVYSGGSYFGLGGGYDGAA